MNKKKILAQTLCGVLSVGLLAGCGSGSTNNGGTTNTADSTASTSKFERLDTDLNVGLVIGTGTIDDRSFNQGCWEGITATVNNSKYITPASETDSDYLVSIGNLYEADFKFIVTPGYYFERADFIAQDKYPDAKFVILDGAPTDENGNTVVGDNTVSISFAEHEAGFIAGVAASLELKEANFGFLGGMQIPAVVRFEAGFKQGIDYANANLGTQITLDPVDVVYQGTFGDKAAGQQIAAQMYDRGVDVIFTAAGGTGMGAITEAKSRATKGETAWVIGVDSDQYLDGVYDSETNASVILTSAVKNVDQATHDMIVAETEGKFPGGQSLVFAVANDGVGLPAENPNLSEETINKVNEIYNQIKEGAITVNSEVQ
ncbi:MAG: BMP family ABC transporter substrate-binding protein [Cellulosilyticum sp.]|nr:BMP family ABC transporter substrate-binding protein [Cellulosilyticum sp.]